MRARIVIVPIALTLCLVARIAAAQVYIPVGADDPLSNLKDEPFAIADVHATTKSGDSDTLLVSDVMAGAGNMARPRAAVPVCAPVPVLADAQGSLQYHQSFMSSALAASLGVPFVRGSTSTNQMVLIRDWTRGVECTATDGETRLLYGQAIRTVITIASVEAKSDLSLAVLAANATINRRNSQVSIMAEGFASPKMNEIIASLAGKELNVETYADFTRVEGALIGLADAAGTVQSVRRLGVVTNATADFFEDSVATAFALYQLKEGRSCEQAKAQFPAPADPAVTAVDVVYRTLMGACNATQPQQTHRLEATQLLFGLKVAR